MAAHAVAFDASSTDELAKNRADSLGPVAACSLIWLCENGALASARAWTMRCSAVSGSGGASTNLPPETHSEPLPPPTASAISNVAEVGSGELFDGHDDLPSTAVQVEIGVSQTCNSEEARSALPRSIGSCTCRSGGRAGSLPRSGPGSRARSRGSGECRRWRSRQRRWDGSASLRVARTVLAAAMRECRPKAGPGWDRSRNHRFVKHGELWTPGNSGRVRS